MPNAVATTTPDRLCVAQRPCKNLWFIFLWCSPSIDVDETLEWKVNERAFVACGVLSDSVRESSGRVLVHCLAGISRSPTVVIAYVMHHLRLPIDDAYRYVRRR